MTDTSIQSIAESLNNSTLYCVIIIGEDKNVKLHTRNIEDQFIVKFLEDSIEVIKNNLDQE